VTQDCDPAVLLITRSRRGLSILIHATPRYRPLNHATPRYGRAEEQENDVTDESEPDWEHTPDGMKDGWPDWDNASNDMEVAAHYTSTMKPDGTVIVILSPLPN